MVCSCPGAPPESVETMGYGCGVFLDLKYLCLVMSFAQKLKLRSSMIAGPRSTSQHFKALKPCLCGVVFGY
jgi:hypothetical protein